MVAEQFLRLGLVWGIIICCSLSCKKSSNPDNLPGNNITISSLRPAHGPYDTVDTLTGKGFDRIIDFDSVLINGRKLTVISRSDEQIIVRIPSLTGTGQVQLWYQGQQITGPVFKYDSILMVTTVAGSATEFGRVDAKGLDARFYQLAGIALDHSGNIYVSDAGSTIRKIDTAGNVTSFAGAANYDEGYVDGMGTDARFSTPMGLCSDPLGNIYAADLDNERIRKISPAGNVTTFAGTDYNGNPLSGGIDGDPATATFNRPTGVASDGHGNIYVVDAANNKIRKITPSGLVSSFAGGDYYHYGQTDGQGSAARFFQPIAIASDTAGNVYVSDGGNSLVRKITPDGTVTTVLGPYEPTLTGTDNMFRTTVLATDILGNLYFAVYQSGIVKRAPDGTITRYACGGEGETDGPAAEVATWRSIAGIAAADDGTLFVTDNNRVRKVAWQ